MTNCCEVLLAIFIPPLAVGIRTGCSGTFCLNLLLTLLGWIPGMVHALIVVCQEREVREIHYVNTQPPQQVIVQQPGGMPPYQQPPPYNPQQYPPPR